LRRDAFAELTVKLRIIVWAKLRDIGEKSGATLTGKLFTCFLPASPLDIFSNEAPDNADQRQPQG
jgi:hypothetical protein